MASTRNEKCEVSNTILPFFFKFNHNLDDESPLVIPPKFLTLLSSKASLSGNKVASNSKSKNNNPIGQLVCSGGLPTFIPPIAPNLYEIQVLANGNDKPLLKKSNKNYDASCKCKDIWAT